MSKQEELAFDASEEDTSYEDLFNEVNRGNKGREADNRQSEPVGTTDDDEDESPSTEVRSNDDSQESSERGKEKPEKKSGQFMEDIRSWIDQLPEEFRDKAEALYRAERSSSGRFHAFQRRIDELESRLSKRDQLQTSAEEIIDSAETDEEAAEELSRFVEKYPAMAKAVEAMVSSRTRSLEKAFEKRMRPLAEESQARQAARARERFDDGFSQIFDTTEKEITVTDVVNSEVYNDWLKTKSQRFREIAQTTADPAEALDILQQFADHAKAHGLATEFFQDEGTSASLPSRADKTKAQRERAKQSAGTPRNSPPPMNPKEAVEGDYDALFEKMNRHTLPEKNRRRR